MAKEIIEETVNQNPLEGAADQYLHGRLHFLLF